MKKLDYGIKVSKRGFNVIDLDQERNNITGSDSPPHLAYALSLPYLYGAKTQVKRYQTMASSLKVNPSGGVIECVHEVSTLFEDLCTVSKYAYRPLSEETHLAIDDITNFITSTKLFFDIQSEDNYINNNFRRKRSS